MQLAAAPSQECLERHTHTQHDSAGLGHIHASTLRLGCKSNTKMLSTSMSMLRHVLLSKNVGRVLQRYLLVAILEGLHSCQATDLITPRDGRRTARQPAASTEQVGHGFFSFSGMRNSQLPSKDANCSNAHTTWQRGLPPWQKPTSEACEV